MSEKYKKIFAVSDVHGFYHELISAIGEAGYNENADDELLVFCGDMFDRGPENKKVFNFLRNRPNCVLIRGNHDDRMAELLRTRQIEPHDLHNGTDETVREFFGLNCIQADGHIEIPEDDTFAEKYLELYSKMQDYYEYGDYIFTHGWIPVKFDGFMPVFNPDWKNADGRDWSYARWLEWQQFYSVRNRTLPEGKTIVCGHRSASLASSVDENRFPGDYSIYYGDRVIAIDACTAASGRVNVLKLEFE